MSFQLFLETAKTNKAIQNDLADASRETLTEVAKAHGFKLSKSDFEDSKNHRISVAETCIDVMWTAGCTF